MTQSERTAILEKMSEDFMEPVITGSGHWFKMDGSVGVEYLPVTYAGPASDVEDPETFAVHYSGDIESVERIKGFGARLSAPGYMDCTDWCVFDTQEQAEQYLVDTYGEDVELDEETEDEQSDGVHNYDAI